MVTEADVQSLKEPATLYSLDLGGGKKRALSDDIEIKSNIIMWFHRSDPLDLVVGCRLLIGQMRNSVKIFASLQIFNLLKFMKLSYICIKSDHFYD